MKNNKLQKIEPKKLENNENPIILKKETKTAQKEDITNSPSDVPIKPVEDAEGVVSIGDTVN